MEKGQERIVEKWRKKIYYSGEKTRVFILNEFKCGQMI